MDARVRTETTQQSSTGDAGGNTALKVIVAIHGIGDQLRCSTVRSVARQFGQRYEPPLPVQPLGFFDVSGVARMDVTKLSLPPCANGTPREAAMRARYENLIFREVYWADIPRTAVKEADRLEESKEWGLSIVSRARAKYMNDVAERQLEPRDFDLAGAVVEEVVETVGVMQNLLALADRAGLFKFDLAPVLRDYVGDVQLVADFRQQREMIVYRFHRLMMEIVGAQKDVELYIVAHSEGTVISFLAILQALAQASVAGLPGTPDDEPAVSTDWVRCLRGFMTIGSPIDKHLLLWPAIWPDSFDVTPGGDGKISVRRAGSAGALELPGKIEWRNYYDRGDPVGFALDTARAWLDAHQCRDAFNFEEDDDIGFSRYWLPGKAHTDYWDDEAVFGHFINTVVFKNDPHDPRDPSGLLSDPKDAKRPVSRFGRGFVSTAIPYLLSFAVLLFGVFMLYKAMVAVPLPGQMPPGPRTVGTAVLALSILLMGATAAARLPRLVKASWKRAPWNFGSWIRWRVLAVMCLAAGAAICWFLLPETGTHFLGDALNRLPIIAALHVDNLGKAGFIAAAIVIALSGWVVPRKPRCGRWVLVGIGAATVLGICLVRLLDDNGTLPLWPVVLGGAIFIYAWWLAILVFDLAFVWHRYVRYAVALDALRTWDIHKKDMSTNTMDLFRSKRQGKTAACAQ